MGGAYKARVAASAAPTLGDDDLLTMMAQIAEQFFRIGIAHDGANRHAQHDIVGAAAVLLGARAMVAAFAFIMRLVAEVDQRAQAFVGTQNNGAAFAAVAAGRTALWHIFFTAEGNDAVATVASLDVDLRVIIKHGLPPSPRPAAVHRPKDRRCASDAAHS